MNQQTPHKMGLAACFALAVLLVFPNLALANFSQCVDYPLRSQYPTTSWPGMRLHPVRKIMRWHRGWDIGTPRGTPIYAADAGVARAWFDGKGGGNVVTVMGRYKTQYLHLNKAAVSPGQRVAKGDLIGYAGNTGIGTGAHLHFEVWDHGDFAKRPEYQGGLLCNGSSAGAGGGEDIHDEGDPATPQQESAAGPPPKGPDMTAWDDLSTREIIASEVDRRFLNPQWHEEEAQRNKTQLMIEHTHMLALKAYMDERRNRIKERVDLLLASRQARASRTEMEVRMKRQREAVAKATK